MRPSEQILEHKSQLEKEYHVARVGIFGSFARGEATESSDVDILVEFNENIDIFQFIRLQYYLIEILGRKVDLVTPDAVKPLVKEQIMREVLYI
ncbi:MAG: nucleotidyltransferase family protein [Chitinophagales bacterium]